MESTSSCRPSISEWISKLDSITHLSGIQHQFDFILVGQIDNVLVNLPEALKKNGFRNLVIGAPGMYLLDSPYIDQSITLKSRIQSRFLDELLIDQDFLMGFTGTFLWCSDEIMKEIADRDIPLALKIKLLPTKKPEFMSILGSKVGQDAMFQKLNIKTPDSTILVSLSDGQSTFHNDKSNRVLIKGNHSGGGAFIKTVESHEHFNLQQISAEWFPILIQDFEFGDTVSIEAFYREGSLIIWMYSRMVMTTSKLGPSMVRKYEIPPIFDFIDELRRIGEAAQIDGFANTSFIWNQNKHHHTLIEFDVRPNTWHQIFLDFAIPFNEIWRTKETLFSEMPSIIEGLRYEPYRLFNFMLDHFRIFGAVGVLMGREFKKYGKPITSSFYDPGLKKRNLLLLTFFFLAPLRKHILKIGISLKKKFSLRLQEKIDESNLKRWMLRFLVR